MNDIGHSDYCPVDNTGELEDCEALVEELETVQVFPPSMIEQFCRDLNEAHNEILRAQGVPEADFYHYDWPEWTPQANSIRWAEKKLKKKLAKTDHWTLYPTSAPKTADKCGVGEIPTVKG